MKAILSALLLTSLVACGGTGTGGSPDDPPTFGGITSDPSAYDGRQVTFETGYLTSFEVSVLTSGFAESYPPQATQPQIWVEASAPRGPCVESAQGTTWSEDVVATGTFRYQEGGGFGHLGAYDMTLQDATLSCG